MIDNIEKAYCMANLEDTIRAMDTSLGKLIDENGISDHVTKSVWKKIVAMVEAFEKAFEVTY